MREGEEGKLSQYGLGGDRGALYSGSISQMARIDEFGVYLRGVESCFLVVLGKG